MTFPVSVEDFLAHQEALIHRELSQMQQKAIAYWVPIINNVYLNGLEPEDITLMDGFIADAGERKALRNFLEAAKLWMILADKQRQGVQ